MSIVTTLPARPFDLDWIKRMADRHRAELGFVRRPALAAAIERGELLIVPGQSAGMITSGCGFVEYHRRRESWSTVYALVSESPGTGRALLEAVPRPRRLKCPFGLAANGFYLHLGGVLLRIEPGLGRPLNVWEWP